MCNSAKHNSRKGRSSRWISPVKRLAIYLRDGFACGYCGTFLGDAAPREVTLDHLTPRVNGGDHRPENLVTACATCNFRRQDTPWRTYAPEGAVVRIERARRRVPNLRLAKAILAGDVPRSVAVLELRR